MGVTRRSRHKLYFDRAAYRRVRHEAIVRAIGRLILASFLIATGIFLIGELLHAKLRKDIETHARAMIQDARTSGDGLDMVARGARGDLLGPDWVAEVATAYMPTGNGVESMHDLAARAAKLRASARVNLTANIIMVDLSNGAIGYVDEMQRETFERDQRKRAALYDQHTNSNVKIEYREDPHELNMLAHLPVDGYSRDEYLRFIAQRWRGLFVAGVVKSVSGARGGVKSGLRALANSVNRSFDTWARETRAFCGSCALTALQASNRSFMAGMVPPDRRKVVA